MRLNSIKNKLVVYLLVGLIPAFVLIAYVGENYARRYIHNAIIAQAKMLALRSAKEIEHITTTISQKPQTVAVLVEQGLPLKRVLNLMRDYVKTDRRIYGMALAFLPQYSPNGSYYCPYYFFKNGHIHYKSLVPPGYNYLKFQWFKEPLKLDKPLWSEPYFDKGGGEIWMSTYSVPVHNKNGKPIGIATADASISFLSRIVSRIHVLETGGAFIVSNAGNILAPLGEKTANGSVKRIVEAIRSGSLKSLTEKLENNRNKFTRITVKNITYFIYSQPLYNTNWNIEIVFPEGELFLPLKQLNYYFFAIILIGTLIIAFIVLSVSSTTTRDINKIREISSKIASGNFDVPIPDGLSDEALNVAQALKTMQASLKQYIQKIEEGARMERELQLARAIQQTFIPGEMDRVVEGIHIRTVSLLAKEVGGDFYGVAPVGNSKTLFYLGDVSGKGVPASLYVAVVKNTIDILLMSEHDPANLAFLLNNHMARLSSGGMFATMFVAILDRAKGSLTYCNAGHLPPLLLNKSGISSLLLTGDPPIGALANLRFKAKTIELKYTEAIIVYSDGLTEAHNEKGELLGEEAVCRCILEKRKKGSLLESLIELQRNFCGSAGLYDDTTIMEVKLHSTSDP